MLFEVVEVVGEVMVVFSGVLGLNFHFQQSQPALVGLYIVFLE